MAKRAAKVKSVMGDFGKLVEVHVAGTDSNRVRLRVGTRELQRGGWQTVNYREVDLQPDAARALVTAMAKATDIVEAGRRPLPTIARRKCR